MTNKRKVTWTVGLGLFAGALGVDLFLRLVPARPEMAIRTAQSFVDCLRSNQLEQAYRLTTRQSEVSRSFGEFQSIVRQQWPGAPLVSVRFLTAHPSQSYGNRLRHWVHGQEVDPQELWLEFSVDGMPFQVREARVCGGGWKVSSFQAHAG